MSYQDYERRRYEQNRRIERSARRWAITIAVLAVAIVLTIDIEWNRAVYGDWRCAFAHCVKASLVKP